MANFHVAHARTGVNEGGWVNDKADRGGETYAGIARNFNPHWFGWQILDTIANKVKGAIYDGLEPHVKAFYKAQYWDRHRLGEIHSQAVADQVFDWLVNSGQAGRQIQQILVDMGQNIAVDNVIGRQTVSAINSVNSIELNNRIVQVRKAYYQSGVAEGWLNSKYLDGLLARAERYALEVVDTVGKNPSNTA